MSQVVPHYQSRSFMAKVILDPKTGYKRLKMLHDALFTHELGKIASGTEIAVNLEIRKQKRTEQQNRYYWLYLEVIARETGYSENELHEMFKQKFLKVKESDIMSYKTIITQSTTNLSIGGFCGYIVNIEAFTGILAPDTEAFGLKPLK